MTQRWWDDPAYALDVLERVDASDVTQGVGTAALGLHAIAKAAVAPLAARTLVDVTDISAALFAADMAPVAKALGAALEPVMGEAAEHYGQLLARDLHARAISGATQAMHTLTGSGVPVPLAIERMAEIVGLPSDYQGKYLAAMKAPAVPPIVRADAADRALMLYAAHLGEAEATAPLPDVVSKDAAFEAEHPRDEDGQFAEKRMAALAREARTNRRRRADRRGRRQQQARQQSQERASTRLTSLADLVGLAGSKRENLARTHQERSGTAQRPAQARRAPTADTGHRTPPGNLEGFDGSQGRELAIVVPIEVVERIYKNGAFDTGELARYLAGEDADEHSALIAHGTFNPRKPPFTPDDLRALRDGRAAILRLGGNVPLADRDDVSSSFEIHNSARFAVRDHTMAHVVEGRLVESSAASHAAGVDFGDGVLVLDVSLDNEEDYKDVTFHKAELETWDTAGGRHLRWVSRDELGQFSEDDAPAATVGRDSATLERLARQARSGRKRDRDRRARTKQEAASTSPSLAALAGRKPVKRANAARPMGRPAHRLLVQRAPRVTPNRDERGIIDEPSMLMFQSDFEALVFDPEDFDLGGEQYTVNDFGFASRTVPISPAAVMRPAALQIMGLGEHLAKWGYGAEGGRFLGPEFDDYAPALDRASNFMEDDDNANSDVFYTAEINPRGKWQAHQAVFTEAAVLIRGSKAALARIRYGGSGKNVTFVKEPVESISELEAAEGMRKQTLHHNPAPIVVLRASIPDDEDE